MRRLLNLVCNSSLKTFLTGELSWDHIAVLISNEQKFQIYFKVYSTSNTRIHQYTIHNNYFCPEFPDT